VPSARGSRRALYLLLGGVALACPCLGVLGAITAAGWTQTSVRPRQSECNLNLKSWFVTQRVRQRDFDLAIDKVGFSPERGNRYAYFAGPGPIEERSAQQARGGEGAVGVGVDTWRHPNLRPITFEDLPPDVAAITGLGGSGCPDVSACDITLVCAGNIDNDDTLDVWSISTRDRTGPDGTPYAEGEPMPHVNDVVR
jgi:hypothetical protein